MLTRLKVHSARFSINFLPQYIRFQSVDISCGMTLLTFFIIQGYRQARSHSEPLERSVLLVWRALL